jgi:hypothetical protein
VVDFVLGTLTPAEALGEYTPAGRPGADAAWQADELADVAVDLYRSALRAADGAPERSRGDGAALRRTGRGAAAHAELAPDAQAAALRRDAAVAAEIPRWFLRDGASQLRSHPPEQPRATD